MFEFHKLHGLGNHFIFFDELQTDFAKLKKPEIIKALADCKFGLGADGIIFVMKPEKSGNHCRMQMFNTDGTEAEMCGNAIRGVAHRFRKHAPGVDPVLIETRSGLREIRLAETRNGLSYYRVDMGKPSFDLVSTGDLEPENHRKQLVWREETLEPVYANVGNPHLALFLDSSMDEDSMVSLGAWLETHPNHPRRINVEFVEIMTRNEVRVHVWERGCGMTSACGTGATAVTAAGIKTGQLASPVTVHMPGGDLEISQDSSGTLFMTGPVQEVADGTLTPSYIDWLLNR